MLAEKCWAQRSSAEQNYINILAKLREWELETPHFLVALKEPTRLYFLAQKDFLETVEHLELLGDFQKAKLVSSTHDRILPLFDIEHARLTSYREVARPSLQITFTDPDEYGYVYGDMDIDLASPIMDVWGFFVHLFELLWPAPTDPHRIARIMRRQGYDV